MFIQLLNLLNQYSNLILVTVTAVYVVLTWRMVREMREAREAESEPHLVATLVPFGVLNVKLRIHNAGRGPALNIKAAFRLEPANGTEASTWLHPVLLSDAFEDFILPSREFSLEKLASKHNKVIVDLQWLNAFKRKGEAKYEIDLKQQKEGWTEVGFLLHPDDTPTQLGKIKDELSQIRHHFDKIDRERETQVFIEHYRRKHSWWRKLWKKITEYAQSRFQTKRA
jgi:hypothetical protein